MKVIENLKIKEKLYIEKLKDGLTVMIIPKKDIRKKYVIWGTNYGSIDNKFIVPGEDKPTEVPMGVAHFLEHKMFEQKNGTNSLDTLTSLGVNANAYTTNDHTAYLFEGIDNFYEALDELMDYVQNPYFTDENVEKEKGIIGQEINMYDDYPEWKVYMNALKAMYKDYPIKLDTAGTVETISHIDKEVLYKCYNTFYNPSNMLLVLCGDFDPEKLIEEVKKRLKDTQSNGEIKRIYPKEQNEIVQEKIEEKMEVSLPLYTIGIKLEPLKEEKVKKHIAIEILLNIIFGESSELYKKLYNNGIIYERPGLEFDFSKDYAYIIITGKSKAPENVYEEFKKEVEKLKEHITEEDFERTKKRLYGIYVREFDDVSSTARMFLSDYFKGVNSFDYLDEIETINEQYLKQVLEDVFKKDKMIISVVRN